MDRAHNNYYSSGSSSVGAALRIARRRASPSAVFNAMPALRPSLTCGRPRFGCPILPAGAYTRAMSGNKNQRDELLRRFEAVISGAGLDDLRQMVADLSLLGVDAAQQPSQPPVPPV